MKNINLGVECAPYFILLLLDEKFSYLGGGQSHLIVSELTPGSVFKDHSWWGLGDHMW